MSYEPKLIIRKGDLDDIANILLSDMYDKTNDEETIRVATFLGNVLDSNVISFAEIDLLICQPELTKFNSQVREYLDDHFC